MTGILSHSDTLEQAVIRLTEGDPGAATALAEVVAHARAVDETCDHPFRYLLQLDRYKVRGPHLHVFFKDVCHSDIVEMLGVLRWAEMGRIRPSDVRASITRASGGLTPPWYHGLDPVHILSLLRAYQPTFGAKR